MGDRHTASTIASPVPGVVPSPIVNMTRQPQPVIPRPSLVFDNLRAMSGQLMNCELTETTRHCYVKIFKGRGYKLR